MDESAIERAKERVEQRADTAALDAVLERTRADLAVLAEAAAEAASSLPARVEGALQEGLREQVHAVGRNLAEIRGLLNGAVRRLEAVENNVEAERHARVDDLALLVDLVSSGWKGVDARLGRVEAVVGRLEQILQDRGGAIVYRLEGRRSDAATS